MSQKKRTNWGVKYQNLPKLNLIHVQKSSWFEFLEKGLKKTIQSVSSITDYTGNNWILEINDVFFDPITTTPAFAKAKGLNFSIPVKIKTKLTNKRTSQTKEENVFLLNLPTMTPEGTFIINGIERGVINQLVRSPGVYFTKETDKSTGKTLFNAEIRPIRGSWLEFFVGKKNVIFARIDRKRKLPATTLLRAVGGFSDKELIKEFSDFISTTIQADPSKTREEGLVEFYKKLRPGEPIVLENAERFFKDRFFDLRSYELGRVGRYKINQKFNFSLNDKDQDNWIIKKEDLIATIKYLIQLQKGEVGEVDDIDSLANRRLRRAGEIVSQIALKPALARFERMIKERMSLISTKEMPSPSQMINPQPLVSSLNTFFRSNQLSSILDQTNPLAEIDLLRRVTVIGVGGLTRERAAFSIRDVHATQYGRICTVRTPEGPNIGLVTYLAIYSQIDEYGFIQAPYRKVTKDKKGYKISDKHVYLDAAQEYNFHISHLNIGIDKNNYITQKWIPLRFRGEFVEGPIDQLDYIDLVPNQIVGTSASLIPFISHDDATRSLMGSHMQCQAVPLVKTEAPIVGTGMEIAIATALHRSVRANNDGKVTKADSDKIIVKLKKKLNDAKAANFPSQISQDGKYETYTLDKFNRTSPYGTCYNQKITVNVGDSIKKGDLLIDGPSTDDGYLAIGKNLLVAYTSIDGLTFEDSFVISDRLVKGDVLTSIQIYQYVAQVVETKLGSEELTKDIPNVSENELAKLTEDGIVMTGATVSSNHILVGKVEPRGEKELTAEERLLRAIFGEKAKDVKDTSLRVPHGEGGVVIKVDILDKENGDELGPGINKIVKIYVAQMRRIEEGDKISGRHGNKGVICRIMPESDMPYLDDGTPVDLLISPLSVISRMNLGQILETNLGYAGHELGKNYSVPVFEKYSEEKIVNELKKAGLPADGKIQLFDGRTGLPFDQKTVTGFGYILKLVHMVDDKVHARSTGPYSLVTQQPLGGKARMGGQRLGEMEVWALEAHRAAHTLQEMLTIKSDDIEGRSQAFQAIIKGLAIPEPSVPESFKVLTKELAGLGINITPVNPMEEDDSDDKEEIKNDTKNKPKKVKKSEAT
ncbi:DNA-directed RNA polymerase subunit beta [Patescibacteria group bacterium]|nr:DNA-directed RNA polymerase subunit beta [Patescibacteria group bacterium]MCG2702462.1 DNA-directed RNA polymerase subunit beta [Candidatus Parcubacteria bacterium]MBU4210298.1 DNA-directed RNA polymerase subunit beta [Patescibacteria group bacterium]MBU4264488.1 DNA-directed RNA polymerase subunit beta [Patescibacteria group bacterium]MBU4390419.1 DNA-directed RNA polymerase subunit beta [Patescibacteria group bacterium]